MQRIKSFALNTIASLSNQIIIIICGFILPQLILSYYGSNVNGLVQSITQFIGLISIFDAGMGVVIEASLYKPIAENDSEEVSKILTSGQRFYYHFVILLGIYILCLVIIMPKLASEFDLVYTVTLLLSISISSFGQYCLGVTNSVLLSADQKKYINLFVSSIVTILNTIVGVILIKQGQSIQIVKLISSLIFLGRPIFLASYVKKHYAINWHSKYLEEPIKQKWNGFAQHVAFLVVGNTDVTILTIMSSFENVSIYSTYFLVINGIKTLISAITVGFDALFGNMLAQNEKEGLLITFNAFEIFVHMMVTVLFGMTAILIVPFVLIYTKGIYDTNYNQPIFAYVICFAYAIYCLRIPYLTIVKVAGHFKETQNSSIIEATINIIISIVCVLNFGLVGVAFGTLIAMAYRTLYLVFYVEKNIIFRSSKCFFKYLILDIVLLILMLISTQFFFCKSLTYLSWIILSLKIGIICCFEMIVIFVIFYRTEINIIIDKLFKRK